MDLPDLKVYKTEVETELESILNWWMDHMIDRENGGFYGKIDNENQVTSSAPKGLVLNARILYTFSSAYALTNNEDYIKVATRAWNYLIKNFLDPKHHGFYWSVNHNGEMLDGKKQVYGQAFAIYAFAEYFKITKDKSALTIAQKTFYLLEQYTFDHINTGYLEAFTKDWSLLSDVRLSDKDQNEKKTMNTHLHIIEAYANLFLIWPSDQLKTAIKGLLANFKDYLIDPKLNHLNLFLTETWEIKSSEISFGHDIEAAWLLQETAEIISDEKEIETFKIIALQLMNAIKKGLDENGGVWHEFNKKTKHYIKQLHWWPQAEAMVGFFNAYQITGDPKYLYNSLQSWAFIKKYIKDDKNGEWFWGVNSDFSTMHNEDKAGFWKCPYHNGRACVEIIKRIKSITN